MKDPGLLEFPQIVLGAQVGRNNIKVQSGSKSDLTVAPPPLKVALSQGTLGVGVGVGVGMGVGDSSLGLVLALASGPGF